VSSLSARQGIPGCWAGWAGSGPSPWSGSRAPAATAPTWPATCQPPGCGSSRWTAPTARTAAGRASPTRWTPSARPARTQSGRARGAPKGRDGVVKAVRCLKRYVARQACPHTPRRRCLTATDSGHVSVMVRVSSPWPPVADPDGRRHPRFLAPPRREPHVPGTGSDP
jgi:hypothetical protein